MPTIATPIKSVNIGSSLISQCNSVVKKTIVKLSASEFCEHETIPPKLSIKPYDKLKVLRKAVGIENRDYNNINDALEKCC